MRVLLGRPLQPIDLSLDEGVSQEQVHHNNGGCDGKTFQDVRGKVLLNERGIREESLRYFLQVEPKCNNPRTEHHVEWFIEDLLLLRRGNQKIVQLQHFKYK